MATNRTQNLTQKYSLGNHQYGKSLVRVVKVNKHPDRHEMVELNVQVLLLGEQFGDSYYYGDNSMIVPTDTVKNTVFVLAKHHKCQPIEDFALLTAKHFMTTYDHVSGVDIKIEETIWERLTVKGQPHHHAFQKKQPYVRFCALKTERKGADLEMETGIKDLIVAKTTQSGFTKFNRCKFTTLPETTERIVRTNVFANWKYSPSVISSAKKWLADGKPSLQLPVDLSQKFFIVDFNRIFATVMRILIEEFAGDPVKGTYSDSVQLTLYEMGSLILEAESSVESIFISLPNLHCFLFDLKRFNLENNNEVFFPQDDPMGLIQAEIVRGAKPNHSNERNGTRFNTPSRL